MRCIHPASARTRQTLSTSKPGVFLLVQECGRCGATRISARDDVLKTLSEFCGWSVGVAKERSNR